MGQVTVASLDKRFRRWERSLARTAVVTADFIKIPPKLSLDIYLVNAGRMRSLNRYYRGQDKATDVLAVEAPAFPGLADRRLGEIYLNPPYLAHKPYNIEFALVHGILHLVGFSHQGKSDKIRMEQKEKQILEWLERTS